MQIFILSHFCRSVSLCGIHRILIWTFLFGFKFLIMVVWSTLRSRPSSLVYWESSSSNRAWRLSADVSFCRSTLGLSSKSNSPFLNLENHSLILLNQPHSHHMPGISFHWPLMISYQDYRQTKYNGKCVLCGNYKYIF